MTIEQLRKAVRAQPFAPFTISLADGQRFHVPHPEYILTPPTWERTFVVADREGLYTVIDLLLVTALDFRGSGPRRRRAG